MKKDRISNPLRRKCSRLELNIQGLNAGARILLCVDWNHGARADGKSKHASRQFLHDRGSSVLSTV